MPKTGPPSLSLFLALFLSLSLSLSLSVVHALALFQEKAEEEGEFTRGSTPAFLTLLVSRSVSFSFSLARVKLYAVSPYFSIIVLSFPFVYVTFLSSSSQILPWPARGIYHRS